VSKHGAGQDMPRLLTLSSTTTFIGIQVLSRIAPTKPAGPAPTMTTSFFNFPIASRLRIGQNGRNPL